MRKISWRLKSIVSLVLVLFAAAAASGCTVRLIADYDEQIDAAATTLQKRMDGFLTKLESNAGTESAIFANNTQFYDDYAVELRAVRLRAASHPKNRISLAQYDLMERNLQELRDAHREAPVDAAAAALFRDLFNQGWQAIIALEVAKKDGR